MNFGKTLFQGFLIWVILYVISFFLLIFVSGTKNVLILFIGVLVVYTFSRLIIVEKNIFEIGITWFFVSLLLNLIVMLLGFTSYYPLWSVMIIYFIIIAEPLMVKYFSR